MKPDKLDNLRDTIRAFATERCWQQFHTPKNLVMALSVEVSELMEHFQWLTPEQSTTLDTSKHGEVAQELADILIYLIRLSDVLGVDLVVAAQEKIRLNAEKYPVEKSKGLAAKYTEL